MKKFNLIIFLFIKCVLCSFKASVISDDLKALFEFNNYGTVSLQGISGFKPESSFYQYHIHEKPVGPDGDCNSTGKHFNPTNINYMLTPPNYDTFEVGDLSGKYGFLQGNLLGSIEPRIYTDSTLAFWGESAWINRSIVIHKCTLTVDKIPAILNESNSKCSRYACGNISQQ
jgi:Cu/Zn superoxide dismutase